MARTNRSQRNFLAPTRPNKYSHYPYGRPPDNAPGNIYYVRLRTEVGLVYKLGFTARASVEQRLSWGGRDDDRLVDSTIAFVNSENALSIEQTFHAFFRETALFPMPEADMPLFDNGQSEIYAEDILGLDPAYTPHQAAQTRENLLILRLRRRGDSQQVIDEAVANQRRRVRAAKAVHDFENNEPTSWLGKLMKWLLVTPESSGRRTLRNEVERHKRWLAAEMKRTSAT